MIRQLLLLSLFLSLLFTSSLSAQDHQQETVTDIATRLQQKYDNLSSLSFNFSQRTRGNLSGKPRSASGQAFFLKSDGAGKMRWNYLQPDSQVLISDGTTFQMYFEKQQQMIITPAENLEQDITFSFFTGKGNILHDFEISKPDPHYQGHPDDANSVKAIKLIPRSAQSQLKSLHLWVSAKSLIQRIEMEDHFGTKTILNLSNLQLDTLQSRNQEALQQLFTFTPPEGTEILQQ